MKGTGKRIGLGVIQHIAMGLAAVIILGLAQNCVILVENLYGEEKRHQIDLYEDAESFEDTAVFSDMFDNAVSDLTTLVVIKGQFETAGAYNGDKLVDVTAFVNRREQVSSCPITAVYSLDNLVRWGKNGYSMSQKTFTKKDFVNYFNDDLLSIEHFYLDEQTETLRYRGELTGESESESSYWDQFMEPDRQGEEAISPEELAIVAAERIQRLMEVYNNYLEYNEDKLVDMAFSYLVTHMDKPVTTSEDDGVDQVHLEMLRPRYATTDGVLQIVDMADNWIDYCSLENNIIDTIDSISGNYTLYESRNDLYARGNTNLSYLVRVPNGKEYIDYSNMADVLLTEDIAEIDNYFEDIGKYISYSVDDVDCVGNVNISDEKMLHMVDTHSYAYPEGTTIWIGVDTDFSIEGDQFEIGYRAYQNTVSRMSYYLIMIGACLVVWFAVFSYLTYTAGRIRRPDGEVEWYLNGFDRIYTEFTALICVLLALAGRRVFNILSSISLSRPELWPEKFFWEYDRAAAHYLWLYGIVCGFLFSFLWSVLWFSLVRRIKSGNLWQDSLLHLMWEKFIRGIYMVVYHKSTTVRTLIPYNLFLLINVSCAAGVYVYIDHEYIPMLLLAAVLIFDAAVGMVLFRRNAEMVEIMDAIKRIRAGEVDCQLEADKLHGENREIAEAVNNIGEGIRSAVATSMKDERMKADLITNVSHDIKTPLTSIISYVDLLKRQKIETEPAKSYIDILDSKSQRLKQLTDDLVEASKISSGNIVLEKERLNLSELLNQSLGEFSEKFEEKKLQAVFEGGDAAAYVYADSRRMWRVIENLFNNLYKYAMEGTRVYIAVGVNEGIVEMSIKNISQMQLNVKSDDLTERFIRGDASRTTEGTGLGLSIAKSLVEAHDGEFKIDLDGDLFKVIVRMEEYREQVQPKSEE